MNLKITSASLILTRKCNLNCSYCLRSDFAKEKEISWAFVKKLLPALKAKGVRRCLLTGGEATLYSKFFELCDMLGRLNFNFTIETNGININEKILDRILKKNDNRKINFLLSLDGSSAKAHDKIRGKGTYQKAIQAIELLKENKIKVNVNTVVHNRNLFSNLELFKYLEQLKKLGVKRCNFSPIVAMGKGKQKKFFFDQKNRLKLGKVLIKAEKHYRKHLEIGCIPSLLLKDKATAKIKNGQWLLDGECARMKSLTVSSRGYHPCLYLDDIILEKLSDDFDFFFLNGLNFLRLAALTKAGTEYGSCDYCVKAFNEF